MDQRPKLSQLRESGNIEQDATRFSYLAVPERPARWNARELAGGPTPRRGGAREEPPRAAGATIP